MFSYRSSAGAALRCAVFAWGALAIAGCYEDSEGEPDGFAGAGGDGGDAAVQSCTDGEVRPCFVEGECRGTQTCSGGSLTPCAAPPEVCDGVDNDCDGTTDEGYDDLGQGCQVGDGVCRDRGRVVCTADGADTMCSARAGDMTREVCDGVDNDCDDLVDEDTATGEACDTGLRGVCAAGVTGCAGGDVTCTPSAEATTEICDGVDNDCDGRVDEGPRGGPLTEPCYDGPGGTQGVGPCIAGTRACEAGAFGACVGQVEPGREICDGVDNDCDGTVDNAAEACACTPGARGPCYSGPEGTAGVGICVAGSRLCNEDGTGYGACEGEVVPRAEVCDALDNDCDGDVDDVVGLGEACGAGQGACASQGTRVCDVVLGRVVCDAQPSAPTDELCDGIDNDCDGTIDDVEGAGAPCTAGEGACFDRGALRCDPAAGALVCDAVAGAPVDETCNGVDDDCDGVVDEVDGLGADCEVGLGACRSTGLTVCDLAAGAVVCGATPQVPGAELCLNFVDDDCDGETDEGEGEAGPDACFARCRDDADCAEGQLCDLDGVCKPTGCVEATVIDAPGLYTGRTEGASAFAGGCGTTGNSPEAVFAVALGDYAGPVCLETAGSAFDTVLYARADCASAASERACNDDGGITNRDSQVELDVEAGEAMTVFVDGFSGAAGDFALYVAAGPCACTADAQCDEGEVCRLGACVVPVCGDGYVEGDEGCDDGDTVAGDGCDADCAVEGGYRCAAATGACDAVEGLRTAVTLTRGGLAGPAGAEAGARFENDCAAGRVITGLEYASEGGAITRMRAICADLRVVDRVVLDPQATTATVGTGAAALTERLACPYGSAVTGAVAGAGGGVSLVCTALSVVDGEVAFGEAAVVGPIGGAPVEPERVECPAGSVATGHAGRVDPAPTALGVRCSAVVSECEGASACVEDAVVVGPVPIANPGRSITLAGSLDAGDPLWDRLGEACGVGGAADHFYDVYTVVNEIGADQTITITAEWLGDGFLHVYRAPFDPVDRANCIRGDDDFGSTARSQLVAEPIPAGEQRVIVASTFNGNRAIGAYTIEVFTDGEAAPELCDNGVDDNEDGLVDCDDPECADDLVACPECVDDGQCRFDEICVGGTCGDGCRVDADCGAGAACSEAECVSLSCGDGVREAGEGCDDGDRESGDGCDNGCRVEEGFACADDPAGPGSVCRPDACALDGDCFVGEICDDGLCIAGCRDDAGCPGGQLCVEQLCVATQDADGDGIDDRRDLDDDNDGIPDADECGAAAPPCDTDGDGIDNRLDLDADGDGIDDAIEAGHGQPQIGGRVTGVVGANGLLDDAETAPDSGERGYAIADADGNGVFDFLERPACDFDDDCGPSELCADGRCADDPACADGGREPNNDAGSATPLDRGDTAGVVLCNTRDADVYRFEVCPGGTATLDVLFAHAEGDIDVVLYDEAGEELDASTGVEDGEQVGVSNDGDAPLAVTALVFGGSDDAAQRYRLRLTYEGCDVVCGDDDGCGPREVCVDGGCAAEPGCDDMGFEGNDTIAFATPLPVGERVEMLRTCRDDEDVYAVEVCPGGRLTVDLDFVDADGDLDVQLLRADGSVITSSTSTTDDERVTWASPGVFGDPPATVYARVYFDENTYAIEATVTDCAVEDLCGDGAVDPGEDCDDGNRDAGDGCDATCSFEVFEIVTGRARYEGQRFGVGGNDRYRFTADGPSRVVIEASDGAGGCPGDLFARLFDGAGASVETDDDDGPGLCPRIDRQIPAGRYTLQIEELGNDAAVEGYALDVRLTRDVSVGGAFVGRVEAAGDDLYVITLAEPRTVALETTRLGGLDCLLQLDTVMVLYDGAFAEIAQSDDVVDGVDGCSRIEQPLAAGTYYVEVAEAAGGAADYELSVSFPGFVPEICDDGVDNDGDAAIDCADPSCAADPVCIPEICNNRRDDDGDGLTDCADEECVDRANCAPGGEGDLRLVDGDDRSGRLEVYHNGIWGTVCDDLWETGQAPRFRNADVACQQLGFVGAEAVDIDVPDGVDPIWLDQVNCVGDEEQLVDCPANALGTHNCAHSEDVGIRCLADGACRVDGQCGAGEICVDAACVVGAREICDSGADEDGDGQVDCDDADCAALPRCQRAACPDFGNETNDVIAEATPVTPGRYDGLAICGAGDVDVYAIDVCAGGTLQVDVLFTHAAGDIDIQLRSAANANLRTANSSNDNETLNYQSVAAQTLYLRVIGFMGAQNTYSVQLGLAGCPEPEAVDFCRLQFPEFATVAPGEAVTVYGRVYQQGVTDRSTGTDADPSIVAALGYGPDGSDPAVDPAWRWTAAAPNAGYDGAAFGEPNNDEYQAELTLPDPAPAARADHDYAYRFSADGGLTYTYCDLDGAGATLVGQPAAGYDPDEAGDAVVGAAVSDCRDACADIFGCGVGDAFGTQDECAEACARQQGFYENARCFADAVEDPQPGESLPLCLMALDMCGLAL